MSSKILGKAFDILLSPISLIVGDKIGHAITGVFLIAAGVITGNLQLAALGAGMIASSFAPKPSTSASTQGRLNASLVPTEARKILFGSTALATDVRYQAYTGTNQEYLDQIVACASHQVQSIDEIWFDNEKAWTKAGGVLGRFAGYLTVTDRPVGTRVNGIAIDATWTANATLTGCAYVYLRYKLTGNSKKTDSPFASGIPSRMTNRGKGMPVYDPRFDSTVAGGSGAQRANDQTTWAYSTSGVESGRNPALQLLAYLIGWRIQNPSTSAWKLAVGRGYPPARIDLTTFITAANVCDETVALAAGGTEPRYRSDGIFSEADEGKAVRDTLLASMNGWLDDSSGKLSIGILKNDLGTPFLALSEKDVIGDEQLPAAPSIETIPNVVRGRCVDASDNALYQMVDYPEVSLASIDGIDRLDPTDFPNVQSASQVQRVAKQRLQRKQYPLRYTATFGSRAWQLSRGKVVTFSHQGLGWSNKLFRVAAISLAMGGTTQLTLEEENAAIYAWSAGETAPVVAAAPTVYDPQNAPLIGAIADSRNVIYRQVSDPSGSYTIRDGDLWVDISTTPMRTWVRIGGSWQTAANYVTQGSDINVANGATKNTLYRSASAPGAPIDGDVWVDTSVTPNVTRFRVSGTWQAGANLVTQGTDIGVANGATSDLKPVSIGSQAVTINGNTFLKTVAVTSHQACVRGDPLIASAYTEVDIVPGAFYTVACLDDDATTIPDGSSMNLQVSYLASTGGLDIFRNAVTIVSTTTTANLTGKLTLGYDGVRYRVWLGGTEYTVGASGMLEASGLKLWPKWTAYTSGSPLITGLRATPYTDNNLGTKDGTLPKVSNLPNLSAFGTSYYFNGTVSYSAAAGTPATATISVTAGSIVSGGYSLAYNAMSAGVSGTGGTSVTYGLYVSDPNRAGGSATLLTTTAGQTLASSDGYILIGACTVTFPASGTGTGGGSRGGGSGSGGGPLP